MVARRGRRAKDGVVEGIGGDGESTSMTSRLGGDGGRDSESVEVGDGGGEGVLGGGGGKLGIERAGGHSSAGESAIEVSSGSDKNEIVIEIVGEIRAHRQAMDLEQSYEGLSEHPDGGNERFFSDGVALRRYHLDRQKEDEEP